jgi:4-hydroxy-4-methyl-2-oxoglutarate aldolase
MALTDQERADLEALSSGQISDAMEALNLRRSVVTGFVMLAAPGSKIVGTAVTVRQVPKNAGEGCEARLTRHQEVTRNIARKGDVVVVDNGGRLDVASWGEFHGYACKQNGVAGAIVDGATRDGPEIRTSGFPTFVRGLSPVSSKWDLKTASINEPVMLGRVEVNPGDIIFADETAVVVIPESKKTVVLDKANEIQKFEATNRAKVS